MCALLCPVGVENRARFLAILENLMTNKSLALIITRSTILTSSLTVITSLTKASYKELVGEET